MSHNFNKLFIFDKMDSRKRKIDETSNETSRKRARKEEEKRQMNENKLKKRK